MIAVLGRYFQSIVMVIMGLFKRALCFLNRKRRDSGSILPTHVKASEVIDMELPQQAMPSMYEASNTPPSREMPVIPPTNQQVDYQEAEQYDDSAFADWGSWDAPAQKQIPSTAYQHKQPTQPPHQAPEPELEPEPDYFSELGLEPTIKKPTKVYVKPSTGNPTSSFKSNRLEFKPESAIPMSAELGDLEDHTNGAWDDDELQFEDTEAEIRQSRKAELERRRAEHQRRNREREQKRHSTSKDSSLLATKLS